MARLILLPLLALLAALPQVITNGGLSGAGPSIQVLNPTSGTVGTTVVITGQNLGTTQGSSTVTFNGVAATATSWSVSSLIVTVPAGATTGSVLVTVGTTVTNGIVFTVTGTSPPVITLLTPDNGAIGSSVVITGTGFGASQGAGTVTFNGASAPTPSWGATSITATVPTTTTGPVVVTQNSLASNGVTFTINTGSSPVVQNLTGPSTVGRYAKAEFRFDLSKTYTNPDYPYDAADTAGANPAGVTWVGTNGVTVDLHTTAPSTATQLTPCFWLVDYTRVNSGNIEVLGRTSNGRWACRFAPAESGTYSYFVTATDSTGTGTSSTSTFTATPTTSRGFVKAGLLDSRFLQYSDGSSYVPIGAGKQWWNPITNTALRSYDYENSFTSYGANGVTLTRIWDSSDFALSVEGATMPNWIQQGTTAGAAQGVEIQTVNVHGGLRSARPVNGNGWYQRLVVSQTGVSHRLTVWISTTALSGGSMSANVRTGTGTSFNTGTLLGQTSSVTGTTAWTAYTTTFTPGTNVVSLNLVNAGTTGSAYVDDVEFGPDNGAGGTTYNIVSDGDFERHFFAGNPGNDPNANPSLARPIGTYMNPWASAEMDAIVVSAETNGIAMEVCTCSGPWFTWPTNPGDFSQATFGQTWALTFYKRSLRSHIARWGYSPSVLAWEYHNEWGHINSSGTPNQYNYIVALNTYLATADPFRHLRTTSQNSQADSPQLWSASGFDIANTHWYLDGHIAALDPDEAQTTMRFAWCLGQAVAPAASTYCTGSPSLGLGDGSAWTGGAKPWIWGEVGVGLDGSMSNTGTAGSRFLHNIVWAGLFTPLHTTPLEWWWYSEDATATAAKLAARKGASLFFRAIDVQGGNMTFLPTTGDGPPGYAGNLVTTTNAQLRAYAMRRGDLQAAYLWVQNKGYTYSNAGAVTAQAGTLTVPGLTANAVYNLDFYDTTTGLLVAPLGTTATASGAGALAIPIASTSSDVAVKAEAQDWPQFQMSAARTGAQRSGTDGTYTFLFAWEGPATTETSLPLAATSTPVTVAGRVQPIVHANRLFIGTEDGNAYAVNATTGANQWTRALDGAVLTTAAVRDNVVVFATVNGTVYGLNSASGAVLWTYDTGTSMTASPAIEGTHVYLANHGGLALALNIYDGTLLWSTDVNSSAPIEGDLAADSSFVYLGDETMNVHKLNASTGAVLATTRLKGQSFQATNPVVGGGKVWWTSFMTHTRGSETIAENLFAASGSLAVEETNIASWLAGTSGFTDNSPDYTHRFAVDIATWTQPFTVLAMPSEGTGHPPNSMVWDNSGRILTYGKTTFPTLIGNIGGATFGTAYTIDIFAINQSTGNRITLGGGTRSSFPWETDNLYALSVAGNELWMNSRFRGTTALRTFATSSTRTYVRSYVQVEDSSNNCPATFPNCYKNGTDTPRINSSQRDTVWWPSTVIVGGKVYLSEDFGITAFQ